jgi:LppP/LprE lipoprotein
MSEPRPRRRTPADHNRARVLAFAGVAGLLLVFVVVIALIAGAGGDGNEQEAAATPTATETPSPTPTEKPKPTPVPLTADQKLERQEAIDLVASRGFEVTDKTDWQPDDTLQVLIGATSTGSHLAFFFVDGTYLGNDSTEPSSKLSVKGTNDLEVTLKYGIYQSGDESGKPTGEPITVTFRYEAGIVEPIEALPAPEQRFL